MSAKEAVLPALSRIIFSEVWFLPVPSERKKRVYRRSSETKQIIFENAIALMSEKGFQGTTIREICAQTGIPVGTFYNCYKSKVDILRRIYDSGDAYMQENVTLETEEKTSLETLCIFGKHYAMLNIRTGIEVMRVLYYPENEWFAQDRPMQLFLQKIISSGQESGEIRSDVSVAEIEASVFDILRGVCYNWCVCNGNFDLEERVRFHMQLLCEAIQCRTIH